LRKRRSTPAAAYLGASQLDQQGSDMYVLSRPANATFQEPILVPWVDVEYLKHVVSTISIPRHYKAEYRNNVFVRSGLLTF
jgi:hypothetical protein